MSGFRLSISKSALQALGKLDKPVRRRLQSAIDKLTEDPRPHGVKQLSGHSGLLRLRVSDYRVIYTIHDGELLIVIVDLGHRREIYRKY